MRLKTYQIYVLLALASAVLFTIDRYGERGSAYTIIATTLEASTFAFSAAATLIGGRSMRTQFETLGSDKSVARTNPAYMRDRRGLQLRLIPAVTALAVVFAARYGLNLLLTWILVPIALVASQLLANRISGWSVKR